MTQYQHCAWFIKHNIDPFDVEYVKGKQNTYKVTFRGFVYNDAQQFGAKVLEGPKSE